jgi:hypothetical protein
LRHLGISCHHATQYCPCQTDTSCAGAEEIPVVLTEDILIGFHCGIGLFFSAGILPAATTIELLGGLDEVHVTLPCRHPHQPAAVLAVFRSLSQIRRVVP